MNALREYVFQSGEVCFSVFKSNADDAWDAAMSTPFVEVNTQRLELVDVLPTDPRDMDDHND